MTAKMRRLFDPMLSSDTNEIGPICPRESTWIPPQNSNDVPPAWMTRTVSPYLSSKKRERAHALGLLQRGLGRLDRSVGEHGVVGQSEDRVELFGRRRP